jgi:hypothetical protein
MIQSRLDNAVSNRMVNASTRPEAPKYKVAEHKLAAQYLARPYLVDKHIRLIGA